MSLRLSSYYMSTAYARALTSAVQCINQSATNTKIFTIVARARRRHRRCQRYGSARLSVLGDLVAVIFGVRVLRGDMHDDTHERARTSSSHVRMYERVSIDYLSAVSETQASSREPAELYLENVTASNPIVIFGGSHIRTHTHTDCSMHYREDL